MAKQYEVIELTGEDLETTLNEHAKKGWRLVQVIEYSTDTDAGYRASVIFEK